MNFFAKMLSASALALFLLVSPLTASNQEIQVANGVAKVLPGFTFNKRLSGPTLEDHILLFTKGRRCALVTWTTGPTKTAAVPVTPGTFLIYDTEGNQVMQMPVQDYSLPVILGDKPAIYVPEGKNGMLLVAALAERIQRSITVRGPQMIYLDCEFVNPLDQVLVLNMPGKKSVALKPGDRHTVTREVAVGRSFEPQQVLVGASGIFQTVTIEKENPLMIDVKANLPGKLTVELLNPLGDPFAGRMTLQLEDSDQLPFEFPVEMGARETIKTLEVPLGIQLPLPQPVRLSISQYIGDPRREVVLTQTPALQFVNVPGLNPNADKTPVAWQLVDAGEVVSQVRSGNPPSGAPWDVQTAMIAYKFDAPGASTSLQPIAVQNVPIVDKPTSLGLWINGDGSGNLLSVRWRDATGKVFQPKPRPVTWKGWRYESFATDDRMQPPLQWDSLVHLEAQAPSSGAVMISGPVLSYQSGAASNFISTPSKNVQVEEDVSFGDPVKLDAKQLAPIPTFRGE